jgi:Protein of unknown function (DUF1064)
MMNKYGNIKTTTPRGTFDSKWESIGEQELFLRLKAREIKAYSCQVPFPLFVGSSLICTYVADFLITHLDDSLEVSERKGYMTTVARIKIKLFKALHPEIKFTLEQL